MVRRILQGGKSVPALFVLSQFVSLFAACRDMVYAGWGDGFKGTPLRFLLVIDGSRFVKTT